MVRRKNVTLVCVASLCCCVYLLYPGEKRDFIKDFSIENRHENPSLKITTQTHTQYIKLGNIKKDIAIENTKKGKDGCLVSTLDSGASIYYTDAEKQARSLFFERLSLTDKKEYRGLLKTFSKAMSSNITYFLYAGTLYGSYFFHGMMPWDDDVDIVVKDEDKPLLQKLLTNLRPEYEVYTGRSQNWKFYHTKSPKAGKTHWKWPFIDIFFYYEQGSFIRAGTKKQQKFIKSAVFPLVTQPFMDMMLPVPRETYKVLGWHYQFDLRICLSNLYDHRLETSIPVKCRARLPCSLLKDKFPFVTDDI